MRLFLWLSSPIFRYLRVGNKHQSIPPPNRDSALTKHLQYLLVGYVECHRFPLLPYTDNTPPEVILLRYARPSYLATTVKAQPSVVVLIGITFIQQNIWTETISGIPCVGFLIVKTITQVYHHRFPHRPSRRFPMRKICAL